MLKSIEKYQKMLKNIKKCYKQSKFKNVTDGRTDGLTDRARCRVACTRLKMSAYYFIPLQYTN